jgi:23S rRNA (adenine2503-C2)-methyltransferase
MREIRSRQFANGAVYALMTDDGYPIEVTDTHLPIDTADAARTGNNYLKGTEFGDRSERWMIGVSCMSGCPVGCRFCATGQLKKYRDLTAEEIVDQVEFVIKKNPEFRFTDAKEFKVNYTRMGEPFVNIENVREAIEEIESNYPGTHHYISTIGLTGSDFSWIKDNITLQISLHSCIEQRRDWLIPYRNKMSIRELGMIRTESAKKTTINLTLPSAEDYDSSVLRRNFDPYHFFVKLSPVNQNTVSINNDVCGVLQPMQEE